MLKAGAGGSTSTDALPAAQEAARAAMARLGETRADLVVVFLGGPHRSSYGEMLRAIEVTTGCSRITGGSGLGVLTLDAEIERGPGVAVLALSGAEEIVPFLLPRLEALDETQGRDLVDLLRPHAVPGAALALFADPFTFSPQLALDAIERDLAGLPTVGGLCSSLPTLRQTWQVQGTRAESGAVAGMVLPRTSHVEIGVAQGCRPIGRPYVITKGKANHVIEVGGRPAVEALKEAIHEVGDRGVEDRIRAVFIGIAIDPSKHPLERGDFLVRHIVGIDPKQGVIAVAETIRVGQTVRFQLLDTDTAREDMRTTAAEVRERAQGRRPVFGLYFDCLGRGEGLFREPHHDVRALREALGDFPLVGFFGNGEIAPVGGKNLLHSYTGVLMLVTQ